MWPYTDKTNNPTIGNAFSLMDEARAKRNIVAETVSDAQGTYSFANVKPGRYFTVVKAEFNEDAKLPCPASIANNNDGWLIAQGSETSQDYVAGKTTISYIFAAWGENFEIKVGDLLQKDVDLHCAQK